MRIRTQFIVSTATFGVILLVVAASLIVTNQRVEETNKQEQLARSLVQAANEIGYLSSAYLLHRESIQLGRWESKRASFSDLLRSLEPDTPQQRAVVSSIKTNQERLTAVFTDVRAVLESTPQDQGNVLDPTFMQISWSRMEVQNQGMIFDAARLAQMLRDRVDELKRTNAILMFVTLGAFGAFLLANYLLTYRRALRSIADLQAGTRVIGSGNLDFAIPAKRNDEIGDLSRAFNRMAADLKNVTASKTELEREIAERKRAEAERERLLQELQAKNEEVQAQSEELQAQSEEIRAANEELRLSNDELAQATITAEEAVRARDEFLSVAAHELKTPVTSLRGFAQVVLRQLERSGDLDPARLRQAMSQIDQQSARLATLANQLLDLSRLEAGKLVLTKQTADISAVVAGVVTTLQRVHPRRDFVFRTQEPLMVLVDPLRLEQVITNLLDNAVKFSPQGSPVEIMAGRHCHDAAQVVVRDYGTGIAPEKRAHIFERFYQAHGGEWYGGMGLGLFISHQIVELHGGSIAVDCPVEGGTRFTVLLPI
ncbi:MAG: HAMP domain-containing protein [Chloroflexota bacterium]|nr:MAG: HAMP domain-containing protein [Chloroflexota bacterium]